MVGEIRFAEIPAVCEFELAHLAVGHVHAAHLNRYDASANFESEVAIDLAAHSAHNGHFVANRFHVFQFVLDRLAGPLPSSLHAGLPRPHHDDVVAHVQESVQDASAETLSVGQEQHHGNQAPSDAQHGQR